MLENKLQVLKALNTTVDGDSDEKPVHEVQVKSFLCLVLSFCASVMYKMFSSPFLPSFAKLGLRGAILLEAGLPADVVCMLAPPKMQRRKLSNSSEVSTIFK